MLQENSSDKNYRFYLGLILILLIVFLPFLNFKKSLFVISSNSMSPTLNIGDLVIASLKDPDNIVAEENSGNILVIKGPEYFYKMGFDPSFWNFLDNNTPIIHRAIDKKKINETWYFLTKGDNNRAPDGSYSYINRSEDYLLIELNYSNGIFIPENEILGIVLFKIPLIGFLNLYFLPLIILLSIFFLTYLIFKFNKIKIKIIKER